LSKKQNKTSRDEINKKTKNSTKKEKSNNDGRCHITKKKATTSASSLTCHRLEVTTRVKAKSTMSAIGIYIYLIV
jgi:hypothetical protein